MSRIVAETHWIERKCAEIEREIRQKYAHQLGHGDESARKKTEKLVNKEVRQAVAAYIKTAPRRSSTGGLILH